MIIKTIFKSCFIFCCAVLPINSVLGTNFPLIISAEEKNYCYKKTERYVEIYHDISLSDRYTVLDSKKFDFNRDGKEDFIAVVEYNPSLQKNCSLTESDRTYGVVLSMSTDNGYMNWFSTKLVGNLEFSEFNTLEVLDDGFTLSFNLGHSYTAFLKSTFSYVEGNILLTTLDYTPQLQTEFEKRIIINYQRLSKYNIKDISLAERLAEDF